ncbi:hypothetical protein [Synechocystis salina]|uniref:hypothetical protein n=1 Tax=Synechocystis salina TaxID=945780 RepID=UPI001D15B480|nr:hypothetical protein [Synechocystis salina]
MRLVIDARADAPPVKTINWAEGITWQQRFVNIAGGQFPVTTVTVNPRSPAISLRPLMANPTMAQGTAPLVTIARDQRATVAINAGFFNRNNQLPLGAVWSEQNWRSGPILNRGRSPGMTKDKPPLAAYFYRKLSPLHPDNG